VGDFWAARNFFLESWWAGYFFPFSVLSAPRHHGIIEQTCKLKKRTLDENGKRVLFRVVVVEGDLTMPWHLTHRVTGVPPSVSVALLKST